MSVRRLGARRALLVVVACGAALLVPIAPADAQAPATIAGTVRDAATGEPVAGARVAALRSGDFGLAGGAEAAADGTFSLTGLAAGAYFLYLLDPAGRHRADFHGAPSAVTATAGATTTVDATLVPLGGRLTATVTEDGTGAPVPGAWGLVLAAATGGIEAGAAAGADGAVTLPDLPVGAHRVVLIDPTGAHRAEFVDDAPGIDGAAAVGVTAGGTTAVTAALAPAAPGDRRATVTGAVAEQGSGAAVAGAWVVALDAATFALTGGAVAGPDGRYALPLAPGRYVIGFLDPTGGHPMVWHDGVAQTRLDAATPIDVEGTTVVDGALPRVAGSVTGTVREDESHDPVAGTWVVAIGPTTVRVTTTGADGRFSFPALPAGTYRFAFVDPAQGRHLEYWDDAPTVAGARAVAVPAGGSATVDASLAPPRCGEPGAPSPCLPTFPVPVAGSGWSRYDIAAGAHSATVTRGTSATAPRAGFSSASGRRYHFAFEPSAAYVLTNPTQPEDQFDWNKLPGLSDCGQLDLAQDGWMFGWRWRTDLTPRVLEVTAYANNAGTHLTPAGPLLTLTADQLAERVPLWFELGISADGQRYEFAVAGPGRRHATTTLPRRCAGSSTTTLKWASGFYFGGTSTAPTAIRAWIDEP